ncbi:MAG: hypothetical protein E6Q97_31675 [Desulfurellales bacterium]|nr:MAG: hypothetical protein E6Q97_31675 [Desulfurellales bacterium]
MNTVTAQFDKFADVMALIAVALAPLEPEEASNALRVALQIVDKLRPTVPEELTDCRRVLPKILQPSEAPLAPAKAPRKAKAAPRKSRAKPGAAKQPQTTLNALERLRNGPQTNYRVSEMAELLGVSAGSASASLRKLAAEGKAKLVSRGVYSLA